MGRCSAARGRGAEAADESATRLPGAPVAPGYVAAGVEQVPAGGACGAPRANHRRNCGLRVTGDRLQPATALDDRPSLAVARYSLFPVPYSLPLQAVTCNP